MDEPNLIKFSEITLGSLILPNLIFPALELVSI